MLDDQQRLNSATANNVPKLAVLSAQFAGHIALRLVHDHLLQMDLGKYEKLIRTRVAEINVKVKRVQRVSGKCRLDSPSISKLYLLV